MNVLPQCIKHLAKPVTNNISTNRRRKDKENGFLTHEYRKKNQCRNIINLEIQHLKFSNECGIQLY